MKRKENKQQKQQKELREISPQTKKTVALLVINTLVLTFIYFSAMAVAQPILSIIVTAGFWLGAAGFIIAYTIYNRAFTRKGITVEMLPDTWSEKQKAEFVEDGKRRLERSKWMLCIIIPLMIPILLDAIALFTWPIIQNLFSFI